MKYNIKTFFIVLREFPPTHWRHVFFLIAGGVFMSLLELVGLSAIFPFMLSMQMPEVLFENQTLSPILTFLNITDPVRAVTFLGVGVVCVYLFKNAFLLLYFRFEFTVLAHWRVRIADRFFRAYLAAPYHKMLTRSSSEMAAMISAVTPLVVNNFIHQIFNLLNQTLVGLFLLGFIFWMNPVMALILIASSLTLMAVHTYILRRASRLAGQQIRRLSGRQLSLLQQSFKGFKDTRLHQKSRFFARSFKETNRNLALAEERIVFFQNVPMATVEMIVVSVVVVVFWLVMASSDDAAVTIAKLATLTLVAFRIIPVINRSITALTMMNGSRDPLERLLSEAEELGITGQGSTEGIQPQEASDDVSPLPFSQGIGLASVSYTYPRTSQAAVVDLTLEIGRGEFVGITGPSGSGKTTLIGLLLGFLEPSQGQLVVDGQTLEAEDIPRLQKIIGYVDQTVFLLDATLAENVAYGEELKDIDQDKVVEALKKAQLWEFAQGLEHGLETCIGEDGKNLSGGQRQRISIARAFYKDLHILILDEASATLDVETEHRFFEFLYGLRGEITVVMVAHRLATLKGCDKIVFMERGLIIDQGSFGQLSQSNPLFRRYLEYSAIPDVSAEEGGL